MMTDDDKDDDDDDDDDVNNDIFANYYTALLINRITGSACPFVRLSVSLFYTEVEI